jgi:hypothetical protein
MLRGLERLSVSAPGQVINEYRIRAGRLELRTEILKTPSPIKTHWRKLGTNEIMLHLLLNTVVGQWLMRRRGFNTKLANQGFAPRTQINRQAA